MIVQGTVEYSKHLLYYTRSLIFVDAKMPLSVKQLELRAEDNKIGTESKYPCESVHSFSWAINTIFTMLLMLQWFWAIADNYSFSIFLEWPYSLVFGQLLNKNESKKNKMYHKSQEAWIAEEQIFLAGYIQVHLRLWRESRNQLPWQNVAT